MATLAELSDIQNDTLWGDFVGKIRAAAAKKAAKVIQTAAPGATVLEWAKQAVANPVQAGNDIAYYVVAAAVVATPAITINQIYTAADSSIETHVNDAVDAIYGV